MNTLTSLSGAALLAATLAAVLVASVAVVLGLRRLDPDRRERAGTTAAAYMTALGSLFAILTGFLINSEYSTLRHTQEVVALEAAAVSQLAYASAGLPPPDANIVQQRLGGYTDDLATSEWLALARNRPEQSPAFDGLADLQNDLIRIASRPYPSPEAISTMRDALQTMTQARRERIAIASQGLPVALFALSLIAGLALIVNAIVVSMRAGPRYAVVALGIVLLVALDLAAILAISAPFRGPFQASTRPLAEITTELRTSQYLPWVR